MLPGTGHLASPARKAFHVDIDAPKLQTSALDFDLTEKLGVSHW